MLRITKEIKMILPGFYKKKLFGNNITPNCEYCRFSERSPDGSVICPYKVNDIGSPCKKYEYDPTKREPNSAPVLPSFSPEDFRL